MIDKVTAFLDELIGSEDFWLMVFTGMVVGIVAYLYH